MSNSPNSLPLLKLVGDELENIYQLGLHDREGHNSLFKQIHHFLSTPYPLLEKAGQKLSRTLAQYNLEHNPSFRQKIEAYSEGLGRTPQEVAYAFLIPELVSSLSKWLPGLPSTMLGCSSFFMLDSESQSPIHGRVLDFPLQDSFDRNERLLLTHFKGQQKVLSFGSAGVPLGSITSMNEAGMTLALHQKFTHILNAQGLSIFEIAHRLITQAETPKDALAILKDIQSVTTWGLYLSFAKTREVLEIDLMGDRMVSRKFTLTPGEVLYFNNQLVDQKLEQKKFIPYGLYEYNDLRLLNGQKKAQLLMKKKKLDSLSLLKQMATPLDLEFPQTQKLAKGKWVDTLTTSSVCIVTMNPEQKFCQLIPDQAPKIFNGQVITVTDCFDRPAQKRENVRGSKPHPDYQEGLRHYARAQVAYDAHEIHQAYHHIQMGMAFFRAGPNYDYGRFFLNVFEFIHEGHPRMRAHQLTEFLDLKEKLSPYLKDQCRLFCHRLSRLLETPSQIRIDDIEHPELRKIYLLEEKIPTAILHKTISLFMSPRIDIRDIITAELKPSFD